MPSIEELRTLQAESLDRKVLITQTRIIEWYLKHKGQVYVSFSGGKDSTVLLTIARQCFPDIEAVFVDTGLEYPEIREFVKTFDNVTTLRPSMRFDEVIKKYGYPVISKDVADMVHQSKLDQKSGNDSYRGKLLKGEAFDKNGRKSLYNKEKWFFLANAPFEIGSDCCNVMKKRPFHIYERITNKKAIIGTMADESRLREMKWLKNGCNSFNQKKPQSTPMAFWTEQDVLHYIAKNKIPYASVYGDIVPKSEFIGQMAFDGVQTDLVTTGCRRTGCMFCMFGVHLEKEPNRFQRMKITHPKQYDYCIREDGLGIGKVLDFIGVKY